MSVLIPMKQANETTDCPVHSFIAKNSYQCGTAECTCGGDVQAAHAAIPTRNYALDHRDECTRPKPDRRNRIDRDKAWILSGLDGEAIEASRRIDRGFEAIRETMETVVSELRRGYISSEMKTAAGSVQELLDALESVQAQRRG
jgi:hypothetical protein